MRKAVFVFLSIAFIVPFAANAAQWRRYAEHGCIGGEQCRRNGTRITIALDSAPVLGVRFFAHDNIGRRFDGKLNVRIDNHSVASYIFEPATDDEVVVRRVRVHYERY